MNALLLAAGLGTRLRPITDTIPKCLVPIHGQPLLGIWVRRLISAGIGQLVVNTHYLSDQVAAYLDDIPDGDRIYLFHETQLLGTGGTLLATREALGQGPVMVVHADNFSTMDIGGFIEQHRQRPAGTIMTMALFETDDPQSCGIVVTDEHGVVHEFHEKVANPPGNLANAAVYIIEPEVIDLCAALNKAVVDLSTEIIPDLIGRIYTYKIDGYHRDIGSPAALDQVHLDISASDLDALLWEQK